MLSRYSKWVDPLGEGGGEGGLLPLTDSQTFNVQGLVVVCVNTFEGECCLIVGPFLGEQTCLMMDEPNVGCARLIAYTSNNMKGVGSFEQQVLWPWKLKSADECVNTHLPIALAPNMDGV